MYTVLSCDNIGDIVDAINHFAKYTYEANCSGWGVLPLIEGRVAPTKPKIWPETDTQIVTSPLGCQTLKHAHMRPIEIPDAFPEIISQGDLW